MRRKPGRLITIGSFDGVHRGHAALIDRTVQEARVRRLKSLALTFHRPPKMVLDNSHLVSILSDPIEKEILIKSRGIDEVVSLDFNHDFSKTRPYQFFRDLLLNRFKAKGLVVGLDFRFGQDRMGGAVDLVRWGQEQRIPVWVIPQVKYKGQVVSSTDIRSMLLAHNYRQAVRYLGHPYLLHGRVVKGRGVGRKIGFPTTNIQTSLGKVLPRGVYVVRGWVLTGRIRKFIRGVGNIGVRPTFYRTSRVSVEIHWLDPVKIKTGDELVLELLSPMRLERKFSSVEKLQRQLRLDVQGAKKYFKRFLKNTSNLRFK